MADFNVRSDAVDVDDIMKQIRTRIREKRGVDYTEADLQHLASIKMEQFLDPRKLRSDLVEQFKRQRAASPAPHSQEGAPQVDTGNIFKRLFKKMARRIVHAAINPQDMADAMHAEFRRREELYYEILHNLVVELTRLGIEVHNLRMHVESLSSRLDFDERRGRALESVVQYRAPIAATPSTTQAPTQGTTPGQTLGSTPSTTLGQTPGTTPNGPGAMQGGRPDGHRRRRRRRRRGRGHGGGPGAPGAQGQPGAPDASDTSSAPPDTDGGDFDDGGDGDGAPDQ